MLFTHITIDELAATPDLDRRGQLLALLISLGRLVPTGAMVLDCSRLDFCRLTEDTEAVEAFRSGNIRDTRDALQLEETSTRLRRDNRQLRDQLELATAVIQRITLENQRLRQQLETEAKVTSISAAPSRHGSPGS